MASGSPPGQGGGSTSYRGWGTLPGGIIGFRTQEHLDRAALGTHEHLEEVGSGRFGYFEMRLGWGFDQHDSAVLRDKGT